MRYLLVPGACHGGWWYDPLLEPLRRAGHIAEAITLAGLDPHGPPVGATNLETHIGQAVQALPADDERVILVGHSYGGTVITGVADRRAAQIAGLLYLDAFVPDDGDSCWAMTNDEQRHWYGTASASTGLAVDPLPFFDSRARPHPIGTLLQAVRLTGAYRTISCKQYVLATDPTWLPHSPFPAVADRLRDDPGWTVVDLASRHNLLADGPDQLLPLLLDLAAAGDPVQ